MRFKEKGKVVLKKLLYKIAKLIKNVKKIKMILKKILYKIPILKSAVFYFNIQFFQQKTFSSVRTNL